MATRKKNQKNLALDDTTLYLVDALEFLTGNGVSFWVRLWARDEAMKRGIIIPGSGQDLERRRAMQDYFSPGTARDSELSQEADRLALHARLKGPKK